MKKRMLILSVLLLALTVGCGAQADTTVTEENAEITENVEENEEDSENASGDDEAELPVAEEDRDSADASDDDTVADNPEEVVVEESEEEEAVVEEPEAEEPAVEEPVVEEPVVEESVTEEPASGPENYVAEYRVEEGYLAPDFTATLLDGSVVNLSDYQGAPVILNFWATWCGPCCNEMPAFQQLTDEYGAGLTVLAVNCGESATAVQSFVNANGYTFPIALDTNYAISSLYPTNGIPYTIVIDEYGVIRHITVGASTADAMYNHYKECLQNL